MSTRSVPYPLLPLEIVECVLSDVIDKQSLENCSLVSKIFLRPSQKHLFRTIKLSLVPEGIKNAENTDKVKTDKAERILEFLISSPVHSSMIFDLSISSKADPVGAKSTSRWIATIENIRNLVPALTRLRTLTIKSFFVTDWTMINIDLRNALFGLYVLPTLQHLELQYTEVSEEELLSLIRIPKLTLVGVKQCSIPSLSDADTKKSPEAIQHPPEIFLRELRISLRGSETAKFIFSVAKAAGQTLRKLCWLTSPYIRDFGHVPPEMDLCDFPSLVFFSISIPLDGATIDSLTSLFKSNFKSTDESRSQLEVVQLTLDYEYLRDEAMTSPSWDWQALDAVLSSPKFAALRKLYISIKKMIVIYRPPSAKEYDVQAREAMALFRSKLPSVLENGVAIEIRKD